MTEYITAADVDTLLGSGWAGTGDASQAVIEANVWLEARSLPYDPTPDAVKRAGALLARESANGRLYADTEREIKRENVSAGSVSSETEYANGSKTMSGTMRLVHDLLRPWLGSGSTFAVRRA